MLSSSDSNLWFSMTLFPASYSPSTLGTIKLLIDCWKPALLLDYSFFTLVLFSLSNSLSTLQITSNFSKIHPMCVPFWHFLEMAELLLLHCVPILPCPLSGLDVILLDCHYSYIISPMSSRILFFTPVEIDIT